MQLHIRTARNMRAYVLTCIEKLQLFQMKAEIGVLVDHSTDDICSQDHEIEHWQSSLASVRKLGDTLFVQNFHSSYLFHLLYHHVVDMALFLSPWWSTPLKSSAGTLNSLLLSDRLNIDRN